MDEKPTYLSDDIGKFILRLAIGGIMLPHGIYKIIHGLGGERGVFAALEGQGLPTFLGYGVFIGEVLAPVLILLGFLTRPAAVILAFNMGMAVFLAHQPDLFKLTEAGGWKLELQGLFFFGALSLLFLGGGRISLMRGRGMLN